MTDDTLKNHALHTHHMHKNHSQITPSWAHFLCLSTHKVCINPHYSWYEWLRSNLIYIVPEVLCLPSHTYYSHATPPSHHTPLLEIRTPPGDCIHCWWGGVLLTVLLNCMEQLVWQPRANPMLYYKHFKLLARPCLPPACHQCAFIHRILEWPFDCVGDVNKNGWLC